MCGRTTDDGRTTEASHPISSPGAFGSGELKIPKVIFPGAKGVSVYCFAGLSNERPKSNVLPFWGNSLLASFWNKINMIKFAFFDFTLK